MKISWTKRKSTLICCKWSIKSSLRIEALIKINVQIMPTAMMMECAGGFSVSALEPAKQVKRVRKRSHAKENKPSATRSMTQKGLRLLVAKRRQRKESRSMDSRQICFLMNG